MKKRALIVFLIIGAVSMIVMSFHYFQSDTTGILKGKEVANRLWYLITFRIHISLGIVAITIGPFQFLNKFRSAYQSVHRVIGYVYTIAVVLSGMSGLIIAQYAMGGWITSMGFTLLSLVWVFTTIKAITAVRIGDISNHKKWMYISYALSFSAITQRTLLLIPLLTGVAFMPIYQLSAWLPWVLNIGIAYALYNRRVGESVMQVT